MSSRVCVDRVNEKKTNQFPSSRLVSLVHTHSLTVYFCSERKRKNKPVHVLRFCCVSLLVMDGHHLVGCSRSSMPSNQQNQPRYSSTCTCAGTRLAHSRFACSRPIDEDDLYQYRHVIVDRIMVSLIPKNRLMDECEWRALGIKQGSHWEHYLIHKPGKTRTDGATRSQSRFTSEPFVIMFRRLLKDSIEPDPLLQQQNTHFPTARVPLSANKQRPLGDSTNTNSTVSGGFRMAVNPFKLINHHPIDEGFNESGFGNHSNE